MIRTLLVVLALSVLLSAESPQEAPVNFDHLVDQYFDAYFTFNPTAATSSGFHQWDSKLEDLSRKAVEAEAASARDFLARFEKFDATKLNQEQQQDRLLVINQLKATLLDLETIRPWEKDPDHYSSGLTYSAFTIMARKFASPEERLKSLIARERQMPAALAAGRANLENPPRVFTEVAIEQMPGSISFFEKDVPDAFKDVKDPKLLAEFKQANAAVIRALEKYENFLKADLLPISQGDYRIGADNYLKKLEYEEMVDIPLDRLLEIGRADLHKNQESFKKVAGEIDPSKTPQQILEELEKEHPTAPKLLQSFRDVLGGLRQYLEAHHIVTIPSSVPAIVQETPPFMRALTSASMDTPGPYETKAKEAYFNVTLPEANWPRQKIEEWLEGFNRGTIISTAVHEVYPGHYTQFLWVQHAPSKVRKLIGSASNAEGWAHYTEQMMLDEGYGRDPKLPEEKDVSFLKLRLGQLQDALLRDARFLCGMEMHTGKMTLDECTQFFIREGYQTPAVAEREAKRGTSDPTYLVYTLGKLEILKLRDDYKQKMGDKFRLQQFHDTFLQQGFPPVEIIRETMLGSGAGPVL